MVAKGIADVQSGKIKEIRDAIGMETNEFNPYRKRLIKRELYRERYGDMCILRCRFLRNM